MAKKKPYRVFVYLLCRSVAACLSVLPRSLTCWFARRLGSLGFYLVSRQRNKVLTHLSSAFGTTKSEQEKVIIAKQVFQNLAMTAADCLHFNRLNAANISDLVDFGDAIEVYEKLLSEKKGLISMTAHMGNWELLAGSFGLKGFDGAVLARRIYYEKYNQWIVGLRQKLNVRTIYRDSSSREILKLLSQNEIIGLLPDQDLASLKGIFVNFFGRPAYTPVAPIRLALTSGAPIVTNFLIRQPDYRYKVVIGDVIRADSSLSKEDAVECGTEQWMVSFEKMIRQYPGQWAWMHNRWKTQPEHIESSGSVTKAALAS